MHLVLIFQCCLYLDPLEKNLQNRQYLHILFVNVTWSFDHFSASSWHVWYKYAPPPFPSRMYIRLGERLSIHKYSYEHFFLSQQKMYSMFDIIIVGYSWVIKLSYRNNQRVFNIYIQWMNLHIKNIFLQS